MSLNNFEQRIYNCYLKHFRNGQPWKPRQNFDDLSDTNVFLLKRLSLFFSKFPHIELDDFFGAPRALHPDENTPSLEFFISRAAIKSYNLFLKKKEDASPEKQHDSIKDSFKFITKFCLDNFILLEDYIQHRKATMPSWMEHYRQHSINPYCLFELGNLELEAFEEDELELWIPGLKNKISSYKSRYSNCEKTKTLVKEATKRIKKLIKEQLNFNQKTISSK